MACLKRQGLGLGLSRDFSRTYLLSQSVDSSSAYLLRLLKGILDQLNYLGGIGPLCTHVQVLATWTHLNGWLEHDVFAISLQHSPQLEHFIACPWWYLCVRPVLALVPLRTS